MDFRRALAPTMAMQVTISLDGVGRIHDRIRGVHGAWERATTTLEGCRQLIQQGASIRLALNCTVSRDNCSALAELLAFASDRKLHITFTYAAHNDLFLRNKGKSYRFDMSAEQTQSVLAFLRTLTNHPSIRATDIHYYDMLTQMLEGRVRGCACVYQNQGVFLDVDAMLYPCGTAADLPYGSMLDSSFEELYFGPNGDGVREQLRLRYCPSCPTNNFHGLADGVWLAVVRRERKAK